MMLTFTRGLGEAGDFVVRDRPELNRWDQAWLEDGSRVVVAIEHENDASDLSSELNHLIPIAAPLRVLITYFPSARLREESETLMKEIERRLRAESTPKCEFLLLTARWDIDDVRDYLAYVVRQDWIGERL